jgi:histidinol-phosphate aminotransferase
MEGIKMEMSVILSKTILNKKDSKRSSRVASKTDLSKVIRMGFNENPYGMSSNTMNAIKEASLLANHYGDFQAFKLRKAIGDFYGLKSENVITGSGSSAIIDILSSTFLDKDDEVLMCQTFPAFIDMAEMRQAKAIVLPTNEDMTYDLDGLLDNINEKTKMIVVCNPNNPTGTYIGVEKLENFIEKVPEDIVIVMDEAYIEFATAPDCVSMVKHIQNGTNRPIVVLRTFSKFYAMAGMRVGYALADESMIKEMCKCSLAWNLSKPAQEGAISALMDVEFYKKTKNKVVEGRNYITKELRNLGCKVYDSQTNFIYFDANMDPIALAGEVLKRNIVISCSTCSRVSVGTEEQNIKFIEVMKEILLENIKIDL